MADIDIPISTVRLGAEVEQAVLKVIRSGTIAQGPVVASLERAFAALAGTTEALAVNSGTTALVLALQGLGIGPGDEVLTSPFTFAATLNAILETGATACFADIDDTFTVDPPRVADAMTARTRVVMPVHLYGQMADMNGIERVTRDAAVTIIEDAAQAHGATLGSRPAGSYGIGCFSLYATKNVTSGEGGIITTNDTVLADRMRVLRNQGMRRRYEYELPGHNYRLTDLQAAVALPQMALLRDTTARRALNAARLTEGLSGIRGLLVPKIAEGRDHVWHQYTIRLTEECAVDRDQLSNALTARGIGTGIYYPRLVFDYDCYRHHPNVRASSVPIAERAARQVLSLPVHPHLSDADVDRIVGAIRELLHA